MITNMLYGQTIEYIILFIYHFLEIVLYIYNVIVFSREVAGNFSNSNIETQPPMMSFKAFLGTQEDTITDEEAIKRYNEYKLEFRRQQLNEFFVAHKDEEWYINSYILIFSYFSRTYIFGVVSLFRVEQFYHGVFNKKKKRKLIFTVVKYLTIS